jgi:hypothetical protein
VRRCASIDAQLSIPIIATRCSTVVAVVVVVGLLSFAQFKLDNFLVTVACIDCELCVVEYDCKPKIENSPRK